MRRKTVRIAMLAAVAATAMPAQAVTPARAGLQAMRELNLTVLGDLELH